MIAYWIWRSKASRASSRNQPKSGIMVLRIVTLRSSGSRRARAARIVGGI